MKRIAADWAEPFKECIMSIPAETEAKTIKLEDWVPRTDVFSGAKGKATLIGDAAHAMTMYRGEAANHGIMDVEVLLSHILPVLSLDFGGREHILQEGQTSSIVDGTNEKRPVSEALAMYEMEMIERTASAVLTSRRACLDAHDYARIREQSPLVSRRVKITSE